eukprot:6368-Pyramimonas_sp.AAC.1
MQTPVQESTVLATSQASMMKPTMWALMLVLSLACAQSLASMHAFVLAGALQTEGMVSMMLSLMMLPAAMLMVEGPQGAPGRVP